MVLVVLCFLDDQHFIFKPFLSTSMRDGTIPSTQKAQILLRGKC